MRSLSLSLDVNKELHKFTITGFLESQKKCTKMSGMDGEAIFFTGRGGARPKICLLACPGQPSDAARLDLDLVLRFQSLVRTFWLTGTKL